MAQVRSWAGLDVHARSVLAVTVDALSGEMRTRRLPGTTSEVVGFCVSLPGPTRVAYEAGPTGYGWRVRCTPWGSAVSSRRRARSSGPRRIASRPTGATPSGCCGC
jgi:hypothetical protein